MAGEKPLAARPWSWLVPPVTLSVVLSPDTAAPRDALAMAMYRSHGTTGRDAQKRGSVCWQRGQASRPRASIRQPAPIARARESASPSAAGSVYQEMHEPISHHMIGIRS